MVEAVTVKSYADFVRGRIALLRERFPEIEEDAELLAGMIDGETDLDKVLDMAIDAFLDRVTMQEAVTIRIDTMTERAARLKRGAEATRAILLDLMRAADKTMVRRPLATLVLGKGRPKLELDSDFNAQGYMRVKTEPMKTDIKAALEAGDQIPGARLVEGEPIFSIRTK